MPAGAARNALDCALLGFRGQSERQAGACACRPAGAASARHRLHDLARHAGDDGRGGAQGGRAQAPEGEARRGGRSGAHPRGARGGAERRADRRCQRGLARRTTSRKISRPALRRVSRWSSSRCRLATMRRLRRSRGRSRCVPTRACTTARRLPRSSGKYDAVNIKLDKTGGLTEALAMAARGRAARLRHHGRLHGGDLAVDGARRCWSRSARASSISTGRCCSRATASMGCATRAAWSIRRRQPSGGSARA